MMQKGISIIGFLLLTFFYGWSQNQGIQESDMFQKIDQDNLSKAISPASLDSTRLDEIRKEVSNGVLFKINKEWKSGVLASKPKSLSFSLLSPEGEKIDLELTRTAGALDRTQIRIASSNLQVDASSSVHYKGNVKNKPGSRVGISILQNEIMGVFFWDGHSYTLGKLKKSESAENAHIFYRNNDLLLDFPDLCHVTENHNIGNKTQSNSESANSDNCVKMYFEVTHDIYLDKGDLTSTLDYINGALSQVKILYENEEINWEVSEILVWDVPDPYDGPNSGDYLVQFRNELDGNYNGDLAALLGYGGGGGVAYLDVLCNNYWGVSYSGIGSSYNDVPEYSWTIMVISHEIGHNIGSPHTHACVWNGNDTPIDGCGPEAGYSEGCDGPLPSQGTVMSYCHLLGGVGIDLGEGFHPQVADLFMDEVSNASCLDVCDSDIPTSDFGVVETQLCEETTVQFYSLASENTAEWEWLFPGGTPSSSTEENPVVTYNNPGNYDVTLEVTSGAGETDELVMTDFISVNNNGNEILIYQDFENGIGDYIVDNPGGPGFEITTSTSGSTYGESALWIDNHSNSNGAFDDLLSPTFSLLAYNSATLFIDYAVTRRNNISDSLVVYASRDGGSTFEWVVGFFENGSGTYATHFNTGSPFIPENADEWCLEAPGSSCLAIDLSDFAREDDVQLRIRNKHLGGNNLYIDRLWVQTDCYDLAPPTADFAASPIEGCASMIVDFTDLSTEFPQSYDWIFDGGIPGTSSEPNPTVVYDEPGEYAVTLTVTNPEGTDTETKINYIVVDDEPTADFDVSITDRTVDLTYTGNRGTSFDWSFGDGNSSTEENPSHTYSEDGEYTIELTVSNDCGTATSDVLVEIATFPAASVEVIPTEGCEPLSVFFDASESTNVDDYYWEFDGGNPSTSTNDTVSVTYSDPGVYDVLFIASNENGDDTISLENYITVDPLPEAEFSTGVNGLTVTFFNLSQDYTDVFWDFGDGQTTSQNSPEHTYDDVGTYTVELVASNGCGADTFSLELELYVPVQISFSGNPISGCATLGVQFTNSTLYADSVQWNFEGGNPSTSFDFEPFVFYENEGAFDVEIIAWNASFSDTLLLEDYIEVDGPPVAGFSFFLDHPTVEFTNTSTSGNTYSWDFGDGNNSTEENPVHEYQSDGVYTVVLTVTNDCGSDEFIQEITITTDPVANFSADPVEGCPGLNVQFSDQSSSNVVEWSWNFEGGTPLSSSEQNPVVTYSTSGTFDVTLIVSSSSGNDTLVFTDFITINPLPEADFNYNVFERQVTFENTSSSSDTYEWDFGDGSSSSQESPLHEYDMDGTYNVRLIASNDCGADTISYNIDVFTLPTAAFSSNVQSGCIPFEVEYTNLSSDNSTSWYWVFEGGQPETSTEQNPIVSYAVPGWHEVTLIATSGAGSDTLTLMEYVEAKPEPIAAFSYDLSGRLVSFINDSEYGEDYIWSFGDGEMSTEVEPDHEYASDGIYEVELWAMNDCDTQIVETEIAVFTQPSAEFSVVENSGCPSFTTVFENLSSPNATSYQWEFPGGQPETSTEENPEVTYESSGVYNVILIAQNPAGSDTLEIEQFIEVFNLPEPGFDYLVDSLTIEFSNTSLHADSYIWDFGDGQTDTSEHPIHTYDMDSSYQVTLFAINNCDTLALTREVGTGGLPQAQFQIIGERLGCVPYTVELENMTDGFVTDYQWLFPGGSPDSSQAEQPIVTYDSAGVYSITLIAYNANGSNQYTLQNAVRVIESPSVSFSFDAESNFTYAFESEVIGEEISEFNWDFGDGNTSSLENPTHTYSSNGTYEVILTVSNICGTDTSRQLIEIVSTSIDRVAKKDIKVYPNPARDRVFISPWPEGSRIEVQNSLGGTVLLRDAMDGPRFLRMDRFSSGMYFIHISTEKDRLVIPVVIQR